MEKQIILTGRVPWEEVPNYYHLANIFLTASKTETQGLTVIEAMAAGILPVAIEDESFNSVIVDSLNGKLFRTKKELRMIIAEMRKDPKKLQQMSKQARINSEMYSSKFYAESILHVYKFALKNKTTKYPTIQKFVDKLKKNK